MGVDIGVSVYFLALNFECVVYLCLVLVGGMTRLITHRSPCFTDAVRMERAQQKMNVNRHPNNLTHRQTKPPHRFHQRIAKELIVRPGSENILPIVAALKFSRELSCTTACARPCETASPMQRRGVLQLTGDDEA
jgi:hypothetical protein